jgi:hypothetical protein
MTSIRAVAVAGAVLAGALVPAGAPAAVAGGPCPGARDVTVVVDLSDLGGGLEVGCAAPGRMNGVQALQRAGFTVSGTQRQGLAFVCRIDGRPAPDERLATQSTPGYREQCVDTPPTDAYWSYWYADSSGPWVYATAGPSGHDAVAGGYEGWRFELNRPQGRPAAPSYPIPTAGAVTGSASSSSSAETAPTAAGAGAGAGGSPWPTLLVAGAAVVLVAGGGAAAWRRSRMK